MTRENIQRIARESKSYTMDGSILTIQNYYYGDLFLQIDIAKLTPEMLEELAPDKEEDEEETAGGIFWEPGIEIYNDEEPLDRNDPESAHTAIEYGLPEYFSEEAKEAWDYFEGTAFIYEYKGRLVITDEGLNLTEAGDGTHGNPYGGPRGTFDSWEEVEGWLEKVAEELEAEGWGE